MKARDLKNDYDLHRFSAIHADLRHYQEETDRIDHQLLLEVARDYTAGTLTEGDLADIYATYSKDAQPGYIERWDAAIPVKAANLIARLDNNIPRIWRGPWPHHGETTIPAKGTSVVYVLYDHAGIPCYVGSTGHLRARLLQHQRDLKDFARWLAYECADRAAAFQLEEQLPRGHMPYLNRKAAR